jgi:hypothetical protein
MCDTGALPVRWFLGIPFTPMSLPDAASRIVDREPGAPFCCVSTPNAQHVVHVKNGNKLFRAMTAHG